MRNKIIATASTALLALPAVGFAITFTTPTEPNLTSSLDVNGLIGVILTVFWSIIVAFIIIAFILSIFLGATSGGDPTKTGQARQAAIYGIIGIVVIILSYAIVGIVRNTFGF